MQFPDNWRTYLAIVAVAVFKNSLNKHLTLGQAVASTFVAVGFAVAFTPAFVAWTGLNGTTYEPVVAALITLLGEHTALLLLRSKSLAELIAILKGSPPK